MDYHDTELLAILCLASSFALGVVGNVGEAMDGRRYSVIFKVVALCLGASAVFGLATLVLWYLDHHC